MGLDWVLKSKIIEGKEEEHAEIRKKRLEARDKYYEQDALGADKLVLMELKETLHRLENEENALEISPCAVLGCPRVGTDQEATDFVTEQYNKIERPEFFEAYPTLESWLKANHGKYVADLAKNREGFGRITGMLTGPESFRGKVIGYAQEIIGNRLAEQAYEDMDPDEMESYADALEEAVKNWEQENEKEITYYTVAGPTNETQYQIDKTWGRAIEPKFTARWREVEELVESAEDCRAAVTWLRFWAKHGFSMHAWY